MKVIDGEIVWRLHATHGFPLELSVPILAARGLVPAWDRIVDAAEKDGANIRRLYNRLREVVGESYPPEFARNVRYGLDVMERGPL